MATLPPTKSSIKTFAEQFFRRFIRITATAFNSMITEDIYCWIRNLAKEDVIED
jgi:hypothetical protein